MSKKRKSQKETSGILQEIISTSLLNSLGFAENNLLLLIFVSGMKILILSKDNERFTLLNKLLRNRPFNFSRGNHHRSAARRINSLLFCFKDQTFVTIVDSMGIKSIENGG